MLIIQGAVFLSTPEPETVSVRLRAAAALYPWERNSNSESVPNPSISPSINAWVDLKRRLGWLLTLEARVSLLNQREVKILCWHVERHPMRAAWAESIIVC